MVHVYFWWGMRQETNQYVITCARNALLPRWPVFVCCCTYGLVHEAGCRPMSPLSSLLPGSPSAWGRLDCSRIAVRRWRPGLVLRPHLLKREDVLYWLCRVSSISNKTANEITLCDVNIQEFINCWLGTIKKGNQSSLWPLSSWKRFGSWFWENKWGVGGDIR